MKGAVSISRKVSLFFNLFMIFLYAVAGIILIFVWPPKEILPELNKYGLGLVLFLYACYRLFRLFRKTRKMNSAISTND